MSSIMLIITVLIVLNIGFFIDEGAKELYKVLKGIADNNEDFLSMSAEVLLRKLPEALRPMAGSLASVAAGSESEQEAAGLLRWLMERSLKRRRDDLQRRLMEAAGADREIVLKEFQAVIGQLEKVKG